MDASVIKEFRLARDRLREAQETYDMMYLVLTPGAEVDTAASSVAREEIRKARSNLKALRRRYGIPDPEDWL